MSRWNIAAAQYAPRHNCVDEHVKHHLHFIAEAAWHGCDLIVFPELSLTGPGGTSLPPPPDDLQLAPLLHAAQSRFITVIAGITLQQHGQRQKGLALFTPNLSTIRRYPQGNGAGVIPGDKRLTIVDNQADARNWTRRQRCSPAAWPWASTAGDNRSVRYNASRTSTPSRY